MDKTTDAIEHAAAELDKLARDIRAARGAETIDGLLSVLRATRQLHAVEASLAQSVVAVLRRFDISWVEIGSALDLTRQSVWDRYHMVEASFSEREERLFAAIGEPSVPAAAQLIEGRVYTRVELQRLFSIRDATLKNGVFQMKDRREIWLFVTESKQSDRVQYEDRLDGDTLYWQGQTSGRTDDRVIYHAEEGNDLLLFYRRSKSEFPGAGFKFVGRFVYVSHEGPPPTHFVLKRKAEARPSAH